MIVYITASEYDGGIIQFSKKFVEILTVLGNEVTFFAPHSDIVFNDSLKIKRYKKQKSVLQDKIFFTKMANDIAIMNPEMVIFDEDIICSLQLVKYIPKYIPKYMIIHDVNPHPQAFRIKKFLNNKLRIILRRFAFKLLDGIILLSENSFKTFNKKYKKYSIKSKYFNIGSHYLVADHKRPVEINMNAPFLLFFGRIDKYKGIIKILNASKRHNQKYGYYPNIIIAGKGTLSKNERSLIDSIDNITLINRFIDDGELVWLFEHCKAVLLPYIEASQSGVLPIAFDFTKPVIISNVDGLKEHVVHAKTGYVFNSIDEFATQMNSIMENQVDFSSEIELYSNTKLDWKKNISDLLTKIRG